MARPNPASFEKRKREIEKKKKKQEKREKRAQRKAEKEERAENTQEATVDPDIAGIVPGPQPHPQELLQDPDLGRG